jgi:hypothetical protein
MPEEEIKNIVEKIERLLLRYPKLKNPYLRRYLEWEYWKTYDNLTFGITKEMWLNMGKPGGLTKYSSLDRAIRIVINKLGLKKEWENARYQLAEQKRKEQLQLKNQL